MSKTKQPAKTAGHKVTIAEAVRDVFATSMNKGQFPLAILGAVALLLIWKLPSGDTSKLVFEIIDNLKNGYFVGYAFAVVFLGGWFLHAKIQRRTAAEELRRVTEERNKLQAAATGTKLQSSDKKNP